MIRNAFAAWGADRTFFAHARGEDREPGVLRGLLSPSLLAALVFRLAASPSRIVGRLARWYAISLFSSDISRGAEFRGPLYLPHPVGIVVGSGARLAGSVTVYHGVTLGADRHGRYPKIGELVVIYPGAVVVGDIEVGARAVVGANAFVSESVGPESVVRGGDRL